MGILDKIPKINYNIGKHSDGSVNFVLWKDRKMRKLMVVLSVLGISVFVAAAQADDADVVI